MIKLIVGLGNVGTTYADTRHNAGFWFVQALAQRFGITMSHDKKFYGDVGRGMIHGQDVRLLMPHTLMNRSGQAVAPMAKFYGITAEQILIAHDELDIGVGSIRLKQGGGHGGHNGLRDIVPHLGADFYRLRIGIGHPREFGGSSQDVSGWVLSKPSMDDRTAIETALGCAVDTLGLMMKGELSKATSQINGFKLPK